MYMLYKHKVDIFFVVSLQDIHLRKPYKSSNQHDQQVVSRATIPKSTQQSYIECTRPPALEKLNQFRWVYIIALLWFIF